MAWPGWLSVADRHGPRLLLGTRAERRWWQPLIGQPLELRGRAIHQHKHVIGLTGQGKSKLLASLFAQLHTQGIAAGVIDPHGDLARECLRLLIERGER